MTYVAEHWDGEGWDQSVAEFLVEYLISLGKANAASSRWLIASMFAEILGIAPPAVTAIVVIAGLPG